MSGWHIVWHGQNWGRSSDTIGVVDFGETFDGPDMVTSTIEGGGDGMFAGESWAGARTFNLHLLAAGLTSAELETQQGLIETASAPPANRSAEETFTLTRPQWSDARFLIARCTKRQITATVDKLGVGYLEASLQFTSYDPAWYGPTVTTASFASGVTRNVVNAGNYSPTRGRRLWTASIGGSLVNVKLYAGSEADGNGIWYVGSLGGGDTLTIDASNMQIRKNNVDVYDACAGVGGYPYPRFFDLPPGTTGVTLHADSGAGVATVTSRPTWS